MSVKWEEEEYSVRWGRHAAELMKCYASPLTGDVHGRQGKAMLNINHSVWAQACVFVTVRRSVSTCMSVTRERQTETKRGHSVTLSTREGRRLTLHKNNPQGGGPWNLMPNSTFKERESEIFSVNSHIMIYEIVTNDCKTITELIQWQLI